MEQTRSAERSARVILRAFALISAIVFAAEILTIYAALAARAEVRRTVTTAITRVELVSRMASALDHERILVDAHIFEKQSTDMAAIERRIGSQQRDFARTAARYGEMRRGALDSGLDGLLGSVRAMEREIDAVLALSRSNNDLEARTAMRVLDWHFETLDASLAALLRVNEVESDRAAQHASSVQLGSIAVSTGLSLAVILCSLALGAWASRVVGAHEEQTIRHARDLEQRNRDLDAFAARVAHDLRGPLTTIGLAGARLVEMLPRETGTAQLFTRGVSRMEALIADLLALSRIASEAGHGICDAAEIASQVEEDLAPAAERAAVKVRYEVAPASIACSPVLFRQVLSNLVENGMKYRRSGVDASVSVEGRTSGREFVLVVSDNGVGMEPEVVARIFEPFYRSPRVAHLIGTGLGLSIVKRIVDASDASLSVESTPGRGTTFTVRFALAPRSSGSAS